MWPVDDPPKGELHTTFMDAEGKSVRFTGPANVAVIMHMTRAAAVAYEKTKTDFLALPAPTGAVTEAAPVARTDKEADRATLSEAP